MNQTYWQKRNDFSESHYKLGRSCGMFDMDVMAAEWLSMKPMESTKENATYIRYECLKFDKDENKLNEDRIKHIAIFELKYKGTDHVKKSMKMNPGEPLWAAFLTAKLLKCRFFLVVATEGKSPFHFIECCIDKNIWLPHKTLVFDYEKDPPDLIKEFFNSELNIKNIRRPQ